MSCFRSAHKAVSCFLGLTAFVASAVAQTAPPKTEASCRAVVQKFYEWYVPEVFREKETWAANSALDRKEFAFSPELRKRLKEDFAASAAAKELVGLDFDPFLASQDPAQLYVVEKVIVKDGRCRADLYSVESGKKANKPDVVPELESRGGRWVFVNFHYPRENGNLLSILRALRKDRQRTPGL